MPPLELDLPLTLEEIFRGGTKHVRISRKNIKSHIEQATIKVDLRPGSIEGTKIVVDKEGDRVGKVPSDLIFTVREQKHPTYTRVGHDLEYTVKIVPQEAILGGMLRVSTLNKNENKVFEIKGGIGVNSVQRFPGEGLPYLDEPHKRGDLLLRFDVMIGKLWLSRTSIYLKNN